MNAEGFITYVEIYLYFSVIVHIFYFIFVTTGLNKFVMPIAFGLMSIEFFRPIQLHNIPTLLYTNIVCIICTLSKLFTMF